MQGVLSDSLTCLNLLFIGLILGGLPAIWKNVGGKKIKVGHIIAGLLFFVMVVGLAAVGETEGASADLSLNAGTVLQLFVVGIVAAATMVIPGVSGSMMLMLMGFYHPVLNAVKDFFTALASMDMDGILAGCGILVPFGLGVVAGVFAIAKLVEFIFERFPLYAYWAIIGLIVSSPIAILLMGSFPAVTVLSAVTGVLCLAVGIGIAMKLGE